MADSQEIEHDDMDSTAQKAEEIGKELGIEKEEIPDYDIQEEDDDKIAKEREPALKADKKERHQLTNKEKRELRKKRVSEKFGEKDAEIRRLREENEQIKQWQTEVNNKLTGINKVEVDKAWNETVNAFAQAEKDHADAFTEGDGAKATKSIFAMYDARRKIEQLQALKQQLEKQPTQSQQVQQTNPRIVNKKVGWESRNNWFKANERDTDSDLARALAGAIANEGFDPATDDYWDELDERLSKYLPDKVSAKNEDEDDDEEEDAQETKIVRRRTSPPVSGGNGRSDLRGKKTISLPTAFINTLKDNGYWDDVPKRNSLIKRYLDGQKQNRV